MPTKAPPPPKRLPKPDKLREPVAWLFGPQLIGSLKGVIVHALYEQLDVRDWMYAPGPIDMAKECGWTAERETSGEAFWFDYLADTGDGQLPTYSVAYLASAELSASEPTIGSRVRVVKQDEEQDATRTALPRGAFLFVGGDTAYHVADYYTLETRFEGPFTWARQDLITDKAKGDWEGTRPLVGIPGNHDYYDMLDGFNRQFRRPIGERLNKTSDRETMLKIPGLRRVQEATYFAAKLPHDWWLYAFDTEHEAIDFRQCEYFRAQRVDEKHPAKLIVATPTPTTVFDKRPWNLGKIATSLGKVGLPLPAAEREVDDSIPPEGCRVDISGDVHHYARYWGPDTPREEPEPTKKGKQPEPPKMEYSNHYASVVAGLGGAFHHPSATEHGELKAQVKYPTPKQSNEELATRLFKPYVIIKGGYIGSVGALLAALFTAAFLVRGTTRSVIDWVVERATHLPMAGDGSTSSALASAAVFGGMLGLVGGFVAAISRARRTYKDDPDAGKRKYVSSFALALAGIGILIAALWWARSSPSGQVGFDVVFYAITIGLVVGLFKFAHGQGAAGRADKARLFRFFAFVHLLMHAVPVALLIKCGSPLAYGLFLASSWLSLRIGSKIIAKPHRRGPALAAWLGFSAWLIAIPLLFHVENPYPETGLVVGLLIALALLLGFVHCIVQFAWYLAVSHQFDGHNNEVGGASRIERFKQFVRFKVEPTQITGYVIAFDDPKQNGRQIEAYLCDVFTIRTKPKATAS